MGTYVQQGKEGDPNFVNLEQVAYWFGERGYDVMRFAYPDLGQGMLDRDLLFFADETIVAGGVGTIREALVRAKRELPPNIDLPDCLTPWIGRKFWTSTLAEVRRSVDCGDDSGPVHVKPLIHHKRFKGVVFSQFRDLIPSAAIEGETPVLVQEGVEFVSEWRASILRNRIVNVAHYLGDPLRFPDPSRMSAALNAFQNCPIACGMDWGITAAGETVLVEVNDGFALGNYGVRGYVYTAMIEARWRQLMGLSDNFVGERL